MNDEKATTGYIFAAIVTSNKMKQKLSDLYD